MGAGVMSEVVAEKLSPPRTTALKLQKAARAFDPVPQSSNPIINSGIFNNEIEQIADSNEEAVQKSSLAKMTLKASLHINDIADRSQNANTINTNTQDFTDLIVAMAESSRATEAFAEESPDEFLNVVNEVRSERRGEGMQEEDGDPLRWATDAVNRANGILNKKLDNVYGYLGENKPESKPIVVEFGEVAPEKSTNKEVGAESSNMPAEVIKRTEAVGGSIEDQLAKIAGSTPEAARQRLDDALQHAGNPSEGTDLKITQARRERNAYKKFIEETDREIVRGLAKTDNKLREYLNRYEKAEELVKERGFTRETFKRYKETSKEYKVGLALKKRPEQEGQVERLKSVLKNIYKIEITEDVIDKINKNLGKFMKGIEQLSLNEQYAIEGMIRVVAGETRDEVEKDINERKLKGKFPELVAGVSDLVNILRNGNGARLQAQSDAIANDLYTFFQDQGLGDEAIMRMEASLKNLEKALDEDGDNLLKLLLEMVLVITITSVYSGGKNVAPSMHG